jgi:phosphatidyl-myo-inositol dimannoside synthase
MASIARVLNEETSVVVVAPYFPGWTPESDAALPYPVVRYRRGRKVGLILETLRLMTAIVRAHKMCDDKLTIASSWNRGGGFACVVLPRRIRGRVAILAHGQEIAAQLSRFKKTMLRWTFQRSDAVVANSSFTRRMLEQRGVTTGVICYCGVDRRPLHRTPASRPTILSVGRLVQYKGFDRTIEALPSVLSRFPDLRYEIAGGGPYEARLRMHVRELGLQDHVAFLGPMHHEDVAQAYERAWCFVLPTRNLLGGGVEGFGIVYIEAAMAGLPCIGSHSSGAEDAIEDGKSGILVDANDTKQIAQAIISLLEDPERAREMGQYARLRAEREFTWEHVAARIMEPLSRGRAFVVP